MRKKVMIATVIFSVIVGILSLFDLALYTDLYTDFTKQGPMWIRYALLLLGIVVCLVPMLYKKQSFSDEIAYAGKGYCFLFLMFISGAYSVYLLLDLFMFKQDMLAIAKAVLFALFALYCFTMFVHSANKSKKINVVIAVICTLAFYYLAIERFLSRTSSLYRFEPALSIVSALVGLVFITFFLKASYYQAENRPNAKLIVFGQMAFFVCTCMEMPHSLYLLLVGAAPITVAMQSVVMGALGILGLITAYNTSTNLVKE
ncbi:MAG: hypothetical protein RSA78_07730 [Oscillospiraceae bacterium]